MKYVPHTVISDYPKALFLACSWFILVCGICFIHGLFSVLELKDIGPVVSADSDAWKHLGFWDIAKEW